MTPPLASQPKAEWRRWARTLDPVPTDVAAAVEKHLAAFLHPFDAPILGYEPLPDEVAIHITLDAIARLDDEGSMLLDGDDGPLSAGDVTAVLVPGRVFDRDGYRLGRGGGHYDRLLPALCADVPVIGVTCEARLVDRVPREPHDVPMTHLATEQGVFSTK